MYDACMDLKAEADEIICRYQDGATVAQVAEAVNRSKPFVTKVLKERGVEITPHWKRLNPNRQKKHLVLPRVLELHEQGVPAVRIAREVQASVGTVEEWLRSEGLTPLRMRAPSAATSSERAERRERGLEMYRSGITMHEIADEMQIPLGTVVSWIHRAGLAGQGGEALCRAERRAEAARLASEGVPIMEIMRRSGVSFYVAKEVLGEAVDFGECAAEGCSNRLTSPERKYCSNQCRARTVARRPRDPARYVTFNCETCGKEVIRSKSLKTFRFCSNLCAARSNTAVHHVIDRETSTVLDSGWEALFWGLCKLLKVPVERMDRSCAVTDGTITYAPDFVVGDLAVEIKGLVDDDDPKRWALWHRQRGPLAVVTGPILESLRKVSDAETLMYLLSVADPALLHLGCDEGEGCRYASDDSCPGRLASPGASGIGEVTAVGYQRSAVPWGVASVTKG